MVTFDTTDVASKEFVHTEKILQCRLQQLFQTMFEENVPADVVEHEKKILTDQAEDPANQQMLLKKWLQVE